MAGFGFQKFYEHIFGVGGAKITGNSTFDANVTISGDLTQTGTMTASSGFVNPVVAAASSDTVPNHGYVTFSSTPTGSFGHPLSDAPVVGQSVTFTNLTASTSVHYILTTTALVNGTTTVTINSSAGAAGRRAELTGVGASLTMVGVTTGLWAVTGLTDTVSVVTTTTTL